MAQRIAKIRLHVDADLAEGDALDLTREHAHYLFNVMRKAVGEPVLLFNGRDGEWRAEVATAGKKGGTLRILQQTRPQSFPPDLWLLFAPIKKARTDFIIEKACELGCARVLPVMTRRTNADRLNLDRARAHMIEAAEQCELVSVPVLDPPQPLERVLAAWDGARALIFCDERRDALPLLRALAALPRGAPAAVLIGPEGGFDDAEAGQIAATPGAIRSSLGPRVLRADTAAVSALTLIQSVIGDW